MTLFLISTLKASIVLAVAFAAVRLMRRQSAALRHMVLAAAVFSAAAAPLLSRITPPRVMTVDIPWAQDLLRATAPAVSAPAAELRSSPGDSIAEPTPSSDAADSAEPADAAGTPEAPVESGAGPSRDNARLERPAAHARPVRTVSAASRAWTVMTSDPERILACVWLAGVAALLVPFMAGLARLRRIERQSTTVRNAKWEKVLAEAAAHYGSLRPIRLIQCSEPLALATWGVRRPVLCIPADADQWTEQRIRVVVFHELAHVRRGDWIWQILTDCVRTVYWFNPLFWLASRSLAQQSEQAADDAALRVGIPELDYASELLALARTWIAPRRTSPTLPPILSMARPSTIERRFKAILDTHRKRNAASGRSAVLAGALFVAVTAAFGSLHLALPALATAAAKAVAPIAPGVLPFLSVGPEQPAPVAESAQENPTPDRPFIRIHRLVVKPGAVRIEKSHDAIEAFRNLGGVGGFQVYFHRQFTSSPLPETFVLTGADAIEALDALCRETKSFWDAYDSTTILVGPDNPSVRKEVEAQVLTTLYLDTPADEAKLAEVSNTVNGQITPAAAETAATTTPLSPPVPALPQFPPAFGTAAGAPPIARQTGPPAASPLVVANRAANAVLFRTTPEKAVAAEETIQGGKAESAYTTPPHRGTNSILTDFAGNIFVLDAGRLRKTIAPAHAQLSPANAQRITLGTFQGTPRELFQTLAERAGIEVLFHRQFANQAPMEVTLEDVDVSKALDLLSFTTGNFWNAIGPRRIVVATDNPTVRRDVERMSIQPVRLPDATPPETTEMVTALRTLLSFNAISVQAAARTILLRDSADKIALAGTLLTSLHRAGPNGSPLVQSPLPAPIPSGGFSQPTDPNVIRLARSTLEVKWKGPVSLEEPTSRSAYEALAHLGGIHILFHRQFADQKIVSMKGQDFLDALDTLSFLTGNFWVVQDAQTIIVATDNPTVRRDVEPMIIKTIYLRNTDQRDVSAVVTALRTLLSFNQLAVSRHAGALVLRETADKIALAEKIIALADVAPPGMPASEPIPAVGISSGVFATPTDPALHLRLQSQLQLTANLSGPIQLRGSARQNFETLAERGGLHVVFDSRFPSAGNSISLDLETKDMLVALDRLSFITGAFWQVVDSQTIRVGTNNATVRRDLEPVLMKTIDLTHIEIPNEIIEVITALRTILAVGNITALPHGITLTDTADNVALAERIVAMLDIPPRQASPQH